MDKQHYTERLAHLFATQRLAVLCTAGPGEAYASLVAFAATADLAHLVFVTTRATQKYLNLMAQPNISLLIDSRTNEPEDFHDAIAVTATGCAREMSGQDREEMARPFLLKHAYMETFVNSPTTALLCVTVNRYRLVERFQNVVDLDVRSWGL